jgi:hypothetical protein
MNTAEEKNLKFVHMRLLLFLRLLAGALRRLREWGARPKRDWELIAAANAASPGRACYALLAWQSESASKGTWRVKGGKRPHTKMCL